MTTSVIGSRYARALAEVVFQPGSNIQSGDVISQLRAVEELMAGSHDLRAILMTPAVTTDRKLAVMNKLLGELGVSQVLQNFLSVLLDHHRITYLSQARASFEAIVDRNSGVVRAEVTSAAPLDQAQTQALETALQKLSGKQVKMNTSVDPGLLGGVVARIGSTVYDGSVRGQLDGMRRKLSSEAAN
jgi:F-type H+-transporting ATPase subunit delta